MPGGYSFPTQRPTNNDGEFSLLAKIAQTYGATVVPNDNERAVLRKWLLGIISIESFDPDAERFFNRAGITDSTQKSAVNTLVLGLKAASLWEKFAGIYPFVGATAEAHSQNLKYDLYNITWHGGMTHGANGSTGNGTTGYGILTGSAGVLPRLGHLAVYVHTPATSLGDYRDYFGAGNEAASSIYFLIQTVDNAMVNYGGLVSNSILSSVSDWRGLLSQHRRSNTEFVAYEGATSYGTNTTSDANNPPAGLDLAIFCRNDNGVLPTEPSDATLSLASFGDAMTHAEVVAYNQLVQAFQTALGRAV